MSDNDSIHLDEGSPSVGLALFFKGVAMGLGDSVPGVSGGTIAVITNIYDKLVYSIRSVDIQAARLLLSAQLALAWQHINGSFLTVLALGILSGLLLSANTVLFLLDNYFPPLMAFFIGLVLSSSYLLKNQFNIARWRNTLALIGGLLLALAVSYVTPRDAEMSYLYVFLSGGIAISAMILPGLSGAFILILLGVYEFILTALIEFDLPYILVFVAGCALGLMLFSRLLAWLLLHHHQLSYSFITGMLLGSIATLWPWQLELEKLSPFDYQTLSGGEPMLMISLFCFCAGLAAVILLHWVFDRKMEGVRERGE